MDNNQSWLDRLAILAKYRKFLLRWLLLWIVIGVVASYVWPPRYRAECSFLPPTEENYGFLGELGSALKLGNVSDVEGAGFMAILHSKRLKDSLDAKFDFRKRYHEEKLDRAYIDFDDHMEVSTLAEEGIGISRIHAFYIRVSDKKPEDAAAMANSVLSLTDRITSELTSQRQHLTREFLENRTNATKESLRVAEDSLRSFSQRTGIVSPDVQIEATVKALSGIEEQIAATEVELHVAMTTLGATHPSVKSAEAKKHELEKQRDELTGEIEQNASHDLIALKKSPELSLDYARRYRDVRTEETLLIFLEQQLEQARLGELRNSPVLHVLDLATAPESRRWPIRSVIVILAFFLGLFGGMIRISWGEWRLAMANSEFDKQIKDLVEQYSPKTLWRVLLGKE